MLKFECVECGNTTALIKKDQEGDMVTECLSCENYGLLEQDNSNMVAVIK